MQELTETNQPQPPLFVKLFILSIVAFQVISVVATFIVSPGYLIPFINNPVGRWIWIGALIWEIIGFALLYKFCPRNNGLAITAITLVTIVNAGPLTLTPMLGPAVVTIINALGPVMAK